MNGLRSAHCTGLAPLSYRSECSLSPHPLEYDRAFPTQCRVTVARIGEAVDVLEDGNLCFSARVPRPAPDQLGPNHLEECFDGGVIVIIAAAAHRCPEAMLAH